MVIETEAEWGLKRENYQKNYRLTHDRKPYDLRYRQSHRTQRCRYQEIYDRDVKEARRLRNAV